MKPQNNDLLYQTDIQDIDIKTLVDINKVSIDITKDKNQRIQDFVTKIKNPYCFRCKNTVIRVSFSNDGESFQELLQDYFSSLSYCE